MDDEEELLRKATLNPEDLTLEEIKHLNGRALYWKGFAQGMKEAFQTAFNIISENNHD